MAKVKDEPHASVEAGCGNIMGCGYGGAAENDGNSTVKDVIAGSVVAGGEISVEKSIHEARYELSCV